MVTPEGYPFHWRVLEGNTQDITTVETLVQEVRQRFGITKCTLVFDRGMVSADNLKVIDHEKLSYISAMDKDEIRNTLLDTVMPDAATPEDWEQVVAMREFRPWDENQFLFYRPITQGGKRYIVTFDVQRFIEKTKHRKRQMETIEQAVLEMNEALLNAKKSRQVGIIEKKVAQLLSRKGLKKKAKVEIEPISLSVNTPKGKTRTVKSFKVHLVWLEDAIKESARLDGLSCFITNMSSDEMNDREAIEWCRRKNKVEEAFHEIKSHLELRPMHVTRTERVKAHVTVCMLANFLMNDMEQMLGEANHKVSAREVLKDLESGRVHRIEIAPAERRCINFKKSRINKINGYRHCAVKKSYKKNTKNTFSKRSKIGCST